MQNQVSKQIHTKNCFDCNECLSSTTNLMRQLRYAWLDLEILFIPANQNIMLRPHSFDKPYEQLELVSHQDTQTLENKGQKHTRFALVY